MQGHTLAPPYLLAAANVSLQRLNVDTVRAIHTHATRRGAGLACRGQGQRGGAGRHCFCGALDLADVESERTAVCRPGNVHAECVASVRVRAASNPQLDLLYLHNPAEMQLRTLGREPFLQRLTAVRAARRRAPAAALPAQPQQQQAPP